MTICEVLSLRYQWEEIVQDYKLDDYNGTIDNLIEFVKSGVKGNRFRSNFKQATDIKASQHPSKILTGSSYTCINSTLFAMVVPAILYKFPKNPRNKYMEFLTDSLL